MKRTRIMLNDRKGLTLLAAMILLIVMSLIGIVVVNMAVQETKIAQNYQTSRIALIWAEAGIEAARQEILSSPAPDMLGYDCSPQDMTNAHYYPDEITKNVMYCIELVSMQMDGGTQASRGSGQDATSGVKTYIYKIDAYVTEDNNGTPVVLRHVQTIEQQARFSI